MQNGDAQYDGLAGNFFQNVGNAVSKAVRDTGSQVVRQAHWTGKALDNPYVKAGIATGLAVTGVGIPLAAGIMATEGVVAGSLKKGGGSREAIRRGYQGAVIGAAAGVAGSAGRAIAKYGSSVLARRAQAKASDANGRVLDSLPKEIPGVGTVNDPSRARPRNPGILERIATVFSGNGDTGGKPSMGKSGHPQPLGVPQDGEASGVGFMDVSGGIMSMLTNPYVLAGAAAVYLLAQRSPTQATYARPRRRVRRRVGARR